MFKFIPSVHRIFLVSVLALVAATGADAQSTERNYQFEDSTIETIDLYRKESELPNKDYNKMLALLDARMAKIKNKSSYDYSMMLAFKAKTYIEKGEYAKALEPMEQGLLISDAQTPTYLDERATSDVSYFLAQLYYQEANNVKDSALIVKYYEKSEYYIERWMKRSPKMTEDGLSFFATVLYSRATLDSMKTDKARIERALGLINQCLHLSTRPKDNLYLLKLVCLQQLDRSAESADIFELLLKNKPENKEYWKQLASTYLSLENPVRAILTLERAQEKGLLNTPADNYNIVGLYFNEGQYEQAAELIEKGFKDNTLENDQKNWELLAYCYQQLNRDYKAIDALKRATIAFPKAGQLDYLIAQNYYTLEKLDDALIHLQSCVKKGGGNKPAQAYLFLAYVAYELKKLDVALQAADKAMAIPDGAREGTRMKKAVQDAINEREAKLQKM